MKGMTVHIFNGAFGIKPVNSFINIKINLLPRPPYKIWNWNFDQDTFQENSKFHVDN